MTTCADGGTKNVPPQCGCAAGCGLPLCDNGYIRHCIAGYVLQRASEEPCAICGGTGIAVVPIAYEDAQGVVHHEVKHQTCHGCNGTGRA